MSNSEYTIYDSYLEATSFAKSMARLSGDSFKVIRDREQWVVCSSSNCFVNVNSSISNLADQEQESVPAKDIRLTSGLIDPNLSINSIDSRISTNNADKEQQIGVRFSEVNAIYNIYLSCLQSIEGPPESYVIGDRRSWLQQVGHDHDLKAQKSNMNALKEALHKWIAKQRISAISSSEKELVNSIEKLSEKGSDGLFKAIENLYAFNMNIPKYEAVGEKSKFLIDEASGGELVIQKSPVSVLNLMVPEQCPLKFKCDYRWENLKPTALVNVRFCESCRTEVHMCKTIEEFHQAAAARHCISWQDDVGIPF